VTERDFDFLKRLIETPSPSGYEGDIRSELRRELEPLADRVEIDMLGNLMVWKNASRADAPRLMLTAHCDEIGLLVKQIDDQGFLRFAPLGGVDPHLMPGQRVEILGRSGRVAGVVGRKPIHLLEAKDKDRVVPFTEQFIDIGAVDGAAAKELVMVGDPAVVATGLTRLQGERVAGRAFDDRVGVFAVARAFQFLATAEPFDCELVALFTVQEELGLRGAGPGTFAIEPDIALALEIGHASDTPANQPHIVGEMNLGDGPAVSRGPNINPALFDLIRKVAKQEEIPLQIIGEQRATSTDANIVQLSRNGVATGLLRVPTRYVHSPSEVIDLSDLDRLIVLLCQLAKQVRSRDQFLPG